MAEIKNLRVTETEGEDGKLCKRVAAELLARSICGELSKRGMNREEKATWFYCAIEELKKKKPAGFDGGVT